MLIGLTPVLACWLASVASIPPYMIAKPLIMAMNSIFSGVSSAKRASRPRKRSM